MRNNDWTPQQILLALNKKGMSLNQLIKENKINVLNFDELERCIANTLNIPLQVIWPSRYHHGD